jgi:hypothetical protein
VTSGVPQGSHLGPLCLLWFVNRILEIFDYVRVLFYADDMKLFLLRLFEIQSDLNILSEWCNRNSLLLNVGKYKTITFARSPVEFSYMLGWFVFDWVSSINDLGVIMDEKMTCGRHGCKGSCNVRIYQETFVGVQRSVHSETSLHVSGSSKTGIRKLRVESIL